jgi:RNA polymerase sigma-70 factor, ECF subfamily
MASTGQTSAQMSLKDPDVRLMLRVRADEQGAFEELVARFQHRLVGVMNHLVGSADEAEDLAQETFLRVYRARKTYHPRCKFTTWLFTIANNLALNCLRSRQRKPVQPLPPQDSGPFASGPGGQAVPDPGSGPVRKVERREMADIIRRALDGLNERQRVAVVLNKFEDMNYAEIATVMGLTTKGVKSLLSRARMNLRTALSAYIFSDSEPVPEVSAEE